MLRALLLSHFFLFLAATSTLADYFEEPPEWSEDAIWYQIFPERFHNGDPNNDPIADSVFGLPDHLKQHWSITPWTGDWYQLTGWEKRERNFYGTVTLRRYGGDLQGVIDKLDYLQKLGVTVLYFNPIFYADSMHKYDGNTYHHIDPYFGPDPAGDLELIRKEVAERKKWVWTAADKLFLKLIKEAKARGLRIVLDGVWNHTGTNCFAFKDLEKNQRSSPYRDWYHVNSWDNPKTQKWEFDHAGWHGHKSLPEFVDDHDAGGLTKGPKLYVFASTRRWMDPNNDGDPSDGIDGWRLDVAEEIPAGFWRDWNDLVHKINPEAYTSAEIWSPAKTFLYNCRFHACMNYAGFAKPVKAWLVDNLISVTDFDEWLATERSTYNPRHYRGMMNLVDSHDTQRIASAIANRRKLGDEYENAGEADYDISRYVHVKESPEYNLKAPDKTGRKLWKMLALLQATYVGAPMIYYGTELGMWGADDPDDRMPTWWPEMTFAPMAKHPIKGRIRPAQKVGFDKEIFDAYHKPLQLRKKHAPLRRGDIKTVIADNNKELYAYSRSYEGKTLLVAFNRKNRSSNIDAVEFKNAKLIYTTEGGASNRSLPGYSGALYVIEDKE